MRVVRALLVLSLLGCSLLVQAEPARHWSVGRHRMSVPDPLDGQPMQVLAFYPSTGQPHVRRIDGYRLNVAAEAPLAMGRFPLLALSHGNTGTPMALHDLALSLIHI